MADHGRPKHSEILMVGAPFNLCLASHIFGIFRISDLSLSPHQPLPPLQSLRPQVTVDVGTLPHIWSCQAALIFLFFTPPVLHELYQWPVTMHFDQKLEIIQVYDPSIWVRVWVMDQVAIDSWTQVYPYMGNISWFGQCGQWVMGDGQCEQYHWLPKSNFLQHLVGKRHIYVIC